MKTAALAKSPTAEPSRGRTSRSKPFFTKSAPVQRQAEPEETTQARLRVGRPGDRFEREADAVADGVVDGRGAFAAGAPVAERVTPIAQRKEMEEPQSKAEERKEEEAVQAQPEPQEEDVQAPSDEEEEIQAQGDEKEEIQARAEQTEEEQDPKRRSAEALEEDIQAQGDEEEDIQARAEDEKEDVQAKDAAREEDTLQSRAAEEEEEVQTRDHPAQIRPRRSKPRDRIERQLRAARGLGNPLPDATRQRMEARLGADLSGVRIHTDALAVELSRALRAQAFTHGRDIYFNEGKFAPGTRDGDHLLAHELTHTIQQGAVQAEEVRLAPDADSDPNEMLVRPELLDAVRRARGEIGRVNAKITGADGGRVGWPHLQDYFKTAFGGEVIHPSVIKKITLVTNAEGKKADALPHWCGIFVWWSLKSAGIPMPDWKIGQNVLSKTTPRPPGALPMKGDIAYREKNQHFALVSGLESAEAAAGKPVASIRVKTVNGNTAGENNLGGQIQEVWHPMSKWHAFFDPVGKLNLPPVDLVRTGRTPDDLGPAAEPDGAPAPPATTPAPRPVVEALATDVPEPVEAVPGPEDAVAVDLPPAPPVPEPEPVAEVKAAELGGSADQAMLGFVDAAPSSMAAAAPKLGEALDSKAAAEQKAAADKPPVLEAKTSGTVEPGITPPDQLPVPNAKMSDGVTGSDPGALAADPHQDKAPPPSNAPNDKKLDDQPFGSFLSWLRNNMKSFMSNIRTSDDGVSTSAGARPNVALEGEADPTRMGRQREEGAVQLRSQRDAQVAAVKAHPGQSNIKPRMIDETRPARQTAEPAERIPATRPDDAVGDYVAAELPAEVRAKADDMLAPGLHGKLAEARAKTADAAKTRDGDRKAEIDGAQARAKAINEKADKDQRDTVLTNRKEVARRQGESIGDAYKQVDEFSREAASKEGEAKKEVGEKVKTAEGDASKELEDGEKKAEKEKETREAEAAAKKRELEKEQENDSWWDRAVNLVKKAVKAITAAIDTIFNKLREAVKKFIDAAKKAAIGLINKARTWVVDKLNKFRDWAKSQVDKYLKDRFPGLARALNAGIDATVDGAIKGVNAVADAAIAGIEALAKALAAALDKILQVFQTALKAAVQIAGAVITGDFAGALKIAIQAACDIAGIDSKPIFDFFERAKSQLLAILKMPLRFINNLMTAVANGFRNFGKKIRQHLIKGLIGWLTGALSDANITLPDKFDIKGIFSLAMQILGLTYDNIKAKIVKRFPPAGKMFDVIEKSFALVKKLVVEGPIALWEEAKAALANLKDIVIGGIRNWLITTVIKEGIVWLLSLTNPASAIVKALKLILDLILWLIERFEQIKQFVLSVYNAVTSIAAGAIETASKAVEDALARSLPVVISLIASVIGLGGVGKAIKKVLTKITQPINKVIDRIVGRIVAFAKKLFKKGKAVVKKGKQKATAAVEKLIKWWKEKRSFKSKDGGAHSLYYIGEGKRADLMVRSTPDKIENFLKRKEKDTQATPEDRKAATAALASYADVLKSEDQLEVLRAKRSALSSTDKKAYRAATQAVNSEIRVFRNRLDALSKLLKTVDFEAEDDALVRTDVHYLGKGAAEAKPLSYLSGNTKGSSPGNADPPGWGHAQALDTKPDGTSMNQWVRGHLVNDNLHGPSANANLVPITQKMNRDMETQVESDAKRAIKEKGKLFYYRTTSTFWQGAGEIPNFPQVVRVVWGELEKKAGVNPKDRKEAVKGKGDFTMDQKPPEQASAFKPSINGGSPTLLLNGIQKEDTGVTSYFVGDVLLADYEDNGRYNSKTDMKNRLWQQGDASLAQKRRRYVNATYNAISHDRLAV